MIPEIPFVVGFAVNSNVSRVLLIEKKRGPSFNIGKWNGIGGKIEPGESPRGAMAREFAEECGIYTEPEKWECFHMEGHIARAEQTLNPRLYCMTIMLTNLEFDKYESLTDEDVDAFKIDRHDPQTEVYNLRYLLEMVKCWHRHPEHRWIEG